MPALVRPTTDTDRDWVKPLMDAAHPGPLSDTQIEATLADPRNVCLGDPAVPIFCCCTYLDVPEGHAVAAGMSTQVAYLVPLRTDTKYLREVIMPLLAKTWYEVGQKFPRALRDLLWAQLDVALASRFETIIGTKRDGRVVSLPTLQEGIDRVVSWL